MPGEKRFRTSFMGGFKKADVNKYIEKMLEELDEKLKEKDTEIEALKSESRNYKNKYDEIQAMADKIAEDREKIAEVLIKAQEKASTMVEDARVEALDEKRGLEDSIEREKEKLVDIRQEMRTLKEEIASTLKKFETQIDTFSQSDDEENEEETSNY